VNDHTHIGVTSLQRFRNPRQQLINYNSYLTTSRYCTLRQVIRPNHHI